MYLFEFLEKNHGFHFLNNKIIAPGGVETSLHQGFPAKEPWLWKYITKRQCVEVC